jgi:hypothetical protein
MLQVRTLLAALFFAMLLSMTAAQVRGGDNGLTQRRRNSATLTAKYLELSKEASEMNKIKSRMLKEEKKDKDDDKDDDKEEKEEKDEKEDMSMGMSRQMSMSMSMRMSM